MLVGASICGSCGMRVNGQAKLVCKTRIEELVEEGETLSVEPMGNQPVIKGSYSRYKLILRQNDSSKSIPSTR